MDFAEITLADKDLFDRYIKKYNPRISEMTFTNIFAWRKFYKFRYTIIDGLLCIVAAPMKSEPFVMMPLGDINSDNFSIALQELKKYFSSKNWQLVFKKITEDELGYFRSFINSKSDVEYDRDNSDYVYLTSDLANLRGKRFDGKRNHINRFNKNHSFEYVRLDSSLIEECSRIMLDWCKEKNCNCQEGDYCERFANLELLDCYNTLDCIGALIKTEDSYEAFTAGEIVSSDTAVIHIEKANTKIDGLYALINQQFVRRELTDTVYVNREQDLGLEGMRKAKLSYHPVKMIDKYTVHPSVV